MSISLFEPFEICSNFSKHLKPEEKMHTIYVLRGSGCAFASAVSSSMGALQGFTMKEGEAATREDHLSSSTSAPSKSPTVPYSVSKMFRWATSECFRYCRIISPERLKTTQVSNTPLGQRSSTLPSMIYNCRCFATRASIMMETLWYESSAWLLHWAGCSRANSGRIARSTFCSAVSRSKNSSVST